MSITEKELNDVLGLDGKVSSSTAKYISGILKDQESIKSFRDNLTHYKNVLKEGKYKVTDYLNAVMYVSFKMGDLTNIEAYSRVFPTRMNNYRIAGKSVKDIHSHVSSFHKSKLVSSLLAQARIPGHIMFSDLYQEAIYVNADLMRNAKREDVKQRAAQYLCEHLKMPEETQVTLDIKNSSAVEYVEEMRKALTDLGNAQLEQLKNGNMSLKDVAQSRIVATVE